MSDAQRDEGGGQAALEVGVAHSSQNTAPGGTTHAAHADGLNAASTTNSREKIPTTRKSLTVPPLEAAMSNGGTGANQTTETASAATAEPLESTPLTANAADSTAASPKDAVSADVKEPTYGTRSRNRPRGSRPNYAEDVEMDYDFAQPGPNGTSDKWQASIQRTSDTPPSGSSRQASPGAIAKKLPAASNGWSTVNANPKDSPIPGTSTFSANPNAPPSKKRKATATSTNHTQVHSTAATPPTVTRKVNMATALSPRERETNMYTFEKTGATLQNGTLIADDGTVFSVNGELRFPVRAMGKHGPAAVTSPP